MNFYDKIKVVKDWSSFNNTISQTGSYNSNQANKTIKSPSDDKNKKYDDEAEKKLKAKNELRQKYSELINCKKLTGSTNIHNIPKSSNSEVGSQNNDTMIFDTDEAGDIIFNYDAALKNGVIKDKDINI